MWSACPSKPENNQKAKLTAQPLAFPAQGAFLWGNTAVFEEDELLDGAPKCPNCGKPLDFEVTEE